MDLYPLYMYGCYHFIPLETLKNTLDPFLWSRSQGVTSHVSLLPVCFKDQRWDPHLELTGK